MASPLVLILLGTQVDFRAVGDFKRQLVSGTMMRLVFAPAFGLTLAALYGSPAPAAGAVMAEQMSDAGELARQYVVWTTVGSVISLFLWVVLLRGIGLL